ncbi:MAG: type II secretion system F family protein, partial [Planctomycetes bacterium]|nr:type II secretion system F family protein [Planctomycetota bacterium]
TVRNTLHTTDLAQDEEWRFDVGRINELRRVSLLYRVFQPVVQGFASLNRRFFAESLPEIGRQVQAAGLSRAWTGAEYLGRLELIALIVSPLYVYFCLNAMGPAGLMMAVVLTVLTAYWLRRRLAFLAQRRLMAIKKRLPFLLDLLTLLMEAGSTFLQALAEAVEEYREHPVGVEFGRVLAELSMGKNRTAALEAMRERLSDDEITSIVGSIVQGENLGTPLALIFRTQADVLRIKRTQRAETLAGEAGVKMLLPAILVMAATVIVILGPFVLSFIYSDLLS